MHPRHLHERATTLAVSLYPSQIQALNKFTELTNFGENRSRFIQYLIDWLGDKMAHLGEPEFATWLTNPVDHK